MEFEALFKARRSCRSFVPTPIPEAQLAYILEAGRWAPSPLNLQPWEFIIIDKPEIKAQVLKVSEDAKQEVIDKDGPKWVAKYGINFLKDASVLIVVLVNPARGGLGSYFGQKHGAVQSGSACIQNIMLACADIGLGALWFTFFRPEKLRSILNIPEKFEISGIIPIGKPKGSIKTTPRKELKVHRNGYDKSILDQ
jgi:5,6-dimethylbenzimidazole synthase